MTDVRARYPELVHLPRPETPFTVATIVLDSGITLKAVLVGDG